MKQGIHPEYVDSNVHCSCGNTFTTRSTKANMRVDLCYKCHPFFTGDQRLVDTGGQVERFMRRQVNRGRTAQQVAADEAAAAAAAPAR